MGMNKFELKKNVVCVDSDSVYQLTCEADISLLFSLNVRFYKKIQSLRNRLNYTYCCGVFPVVYKVLTDT